MRFYVIIAVPGEEGYYQHDCLYIVCVRNVNYGIAKYEMLNILMSTGHS